MDKDSRITWLILGAIIATAVSMVARPFLNKYVFQKLGIETARRGRY